MRSRTGFTIVEILATLGIIGVLAAILLPAITAVRGNAVRAKTQANMRQVFSLIQAYSGANRDIIVPSLFDHREAAVSGHPRSGPKKTQQWGLLGERLMGTWADILWNDNNFGPIAVSMATTANPDAAADLGYRTDEPDGMLYEVITNYDKSPFRSNSPISRDTLFLYSGSGSEKISEDPDIDENKFGSRTLNVDEPVFLAANNFFDGRPGTVAGGTPHSKRIKTNHPYDARAELCRASQNLATGVTTTGQYCALFTTGQIAQPDTSVYLIESAACQTIDTVVDPLSGTASFAPLFGNADLTQVNFGSSNDQCSMLLLDGHVQAESRWEDLIDLEGASRELDLDGKPTANTSDETSDQGRRLRFRHLDMR